MDDTAQVTCQECPECHAPMPVQEPYPVWCDQCGWNIRVRPPEDAKNLFERLDEKVGKQQGDALLAQLVHAQSLRPAWTPYRILAVALATLVHGLTLLLAAGGIFLLLRYRSNVLLDLAAIILLIAALVVRPRVAKAPETCLPRAKLPTWYAVTERIAAALGAPNVATIVINESFNASIYRYGWRGRRALCLGLPFMTALDARERVALLGHEIAHGVNGDLALGTYVGSALRSLSEWHAVLYPDTIWASGRRLDFILLVPFHLLTWLLSFVPYGLAYAIARLLWSDRQRAEYLADILGARVAGTAAALAMQEKTGCYRLFLRILRRIKLQGSGEDLFAELQREVREMPERERERIRREQAMEDTRLDDVHPPTHFRLALLRAHPVAAAGVTIAPEEMARMDAELAPFGKAIQRELVNSVYLNMVY